MTAQNRDLDYRRGLVTVGKFKRGRTLRSVFFRACFSERGNVRYICRVNAFAHSN